MAVALINGRNFVHKDIVFNVGGVPMTSLSNLSVTYTAVKEFSYGTGALPVGYGEGRREPVEVSFELSMTDFKALSQATDTGDILDLGPFDIPVTLLNGVNTWGLTIENFMVRETPFTSDIDTTDIKVPVAGIASSIVWKK